MKQYTRTFEVVDGVEVTKNFIRENADGSTSSIPESLDNRHYMQLMEEVEAGTSTIVDVDMTIPAIPQWSIERTTDLENGGYGTVIEQLEILGEQGIDAFQQHIATIKAAYPKD
jgi:hypothetical protein